MEVSTAVATKTVGFQPGNHYGRANSGGAAPGAPRRWVTQQLISELNTMTPDLNNPQKTRRRIARVVDRLITNAEAGDNVAIKEIFDRVEGRVPQAVALNVNDQRDANSIRIDPADATDEELALIMEIAKRRKAPQLEAQITKTVEEADGPSR